jgi:hypothetical protein
MFSQLHHVDHATIGAHLEPIGRARRGEHRVSSELRQHVAYHLVGAQGLAAADA